MEIEKLDVANIIEIQKIREVLINHPDLLSMFELLVIMSNNRLNNECKKIDDTEPVIETNIEPELTDDDDDDN